MANLLVLLNELGPAGREIKVDDPQIWSLPCQEFGIQLRVIEPIQARVLVLPQDDACLIRGQLSGKVELDCNRCADSTLVEIKQDFDEFESFPGLEEQAELEADLDDSSLISLGKQGPILNLGALLWEEFYMALPVKPLCSPDCKGICAQCGANLNHSSCDCSPIGGDSRLAALRNWSGKRADSGE